MSADLIWFTKPKTNDISNIKKPIAREIWDTDGSMTTNEAAVGEELIPFLRGLSNNDWYKEDANQLIKAIEKYGEVYIKVSW